jgi:uncharacterized protein YbjT (DUF2867 family)
MILVTGATGNVGGELVRQLAGRPVRALMRRPSEVPAGVEAAIGDLDQPASLRTALQGAHGVFLLGGYRDMPGVLAEIQRAQVPHVVLLSSRSAAGPGAGNAVVETWQTSEAAVRDSGVPFTILRPSGFMSNALRWLPQLRRGDVVRVPFASVPIAAIDPHDIAAVAVAAFDQGPSGRTLALTGPRPLLPEDQLRTLGRLLGRDLRVEALDNEEARAELGQTLPARFVEAMMRFFANGEFDDAAVLPTVEEVTGRPPRTFEVWANANQAAFR